MTCGHHARIEKSHANDACPACGGDQQSFAIITDRTGKNFQASTLAVALEFPLVERLRLPGRLVNETNVMDKVLRPEDRVGVGDIAWRRIEPVSDLRDPSSHQIAVRGFT